MQQIHVFLVLAGLVLWAIPQSILDEFPTCAVNCIEDVLTASCDNDTSCICDSSSTISSLSCCIYEDCDTADQNTTIELANEICGFSGVSIPQSASCPSTTTSISSPTSSTSSSITFISTSTTATTESDTSSSNQNPTKYLSRGAKAGIGISAISGGVLLILIAVLLYYQRRRVGRNPDHNHTANVPPRSPELIDEPELPSVPATGIGKDAPTTTDRTASPDVSPIVELAIPVRTSLLDPELENTQPASSHSPSGRDTMAIMELPIAGAVDHPSNLLTASDISELEKQALEKEASGAYEAAEEICLQVVGWRETQQGPTQRDTLTSIYRLVLVLNLRNKTAEADELYRELMTRRKTLLNPRPSSPLLGEKMMLENEYEAAEKMDRQEMELNRRVLGDEYLLTLFSIGNLATVLRLQGKLEEAEQWYRLTLELSDKVLGPLHAYSLQIINNLAVTLSMQDKNDEAKEMYRQTLERDINKRGVQPSRYLPQLTQSERGATQGRGSSFLSVKGDSA